MAEIITDGSQKELKKHGSDEFPLLVSYEKLSGYKSGSFLWHWHPEIEITLCLEGQILYKVNQCTYHMKTGDIQFIKFFFLFIETYDFFYILSEETVPGLGVININRREREVL